MVPTSLKATTCPLQHTILPPDLAAQWVKVVPPCQTTEVRVLRCQTTGVTYQEEEEPVRGREKLQLLITGISNRYMAAAMAMILDSS